MNNCVDFGLILRQLACADCTAPLILGINARDPEATVSACVDAREELLSLQEDHA